MNHDSLDSSGSWQAIRGRGSLVFGIWRLKFPRRRRGYIFLISVLVIGAIASTTAVSLVLLGLASELTSLSVTQSAQAQELARTCVERALRSLRADLSYGDDESFTLTDGNCTIEVGGSGNNDRTLCATGTSADVVRRLEVDVARIYPSVLIDSWTEVEAFSLCP